MGHADVVKAGLGQFSGDVLFMARDKPVFQVSPPPGLALPVGSAPSFYLTLYTGAPVRPL